jgi:hypothetical protein
LYGSFAEDALVNDVRLGQRCGLVNDVRGVNDARFGQRCARREFQGNDASDALSLTHYFTVRDDRIVTLNIVRKS